MRSGANPIGLKKAAGWIAVLLAAGCATTKVETLKEYSGKDPLPRPTRVLVHDFAVSPDELSLNSGPLAKLARAVAGTPQQEEQLKVGRAVARALSEALMKELEELGFSAERATATGPDGDGILSIEGVFLSIDEGNRARRLVIGFGAGGTSVKTRVIATLGTRSGPLLLQQFETVAESSKKPGMGPMAGVGGAVTGAATGVAVSGAAGAASELNQDVKGNAARTAKEVAKALSRFFAHQGWIPKDKIIE